MPVEGFDGRLKVTWVPVLFAVGVLEMSERMIFEREIIYSLAGVCVGVISNLRRFFYAMIIGEFRSTLPMAWY